MTDNNRIKKALEDVSNGMSLSAAANKYNVPRSSLTVLAHKNGVVSPHQKRMSELEENKKQARILRENGWSFGKIAKRFSICETSAKTWCEGITLTPDQHAANSRGLFEKQSLAVKLREDGLFISEIAKKLKCSKSSVCLWLSKAKVGVFASGSSSKKISVSIKNKRDANVNRRKLEKTNESKKRDLNIFEMRKGGWSFVDIAKETGLDKTTVGQICKKFSFTDKEKKIIKNKVHETTMARRHAGELKPVGGIRQGVERSKFGYYKGIYCSSTYELCWVIYNLDHGNEVKRFDGFLECPEQNFKYYPDFIQNENEIIEIKGYEDESVARKTALAEKQGYKVTLLKEKDLQDVFKYVDDTYGVKPRSRHTLYDNHHPVHVFNCSQCQKGFEVFKLRDRHKDGRTVFCSVKCAATYRAGQANASTRRKIPLSETQNVKSDRASGMTFKAIAEKYGVSMTVIQNVLKR